MKPSSRAILTGLIWGTGQAALLTYAAKTGILFVQSSDANIVLAKTLALGLVSATGLATGYVIGEAEGAVQALLVSQLIAGSIFWVTMFVFYQPPILALIVIQVLNFLLALAGAIPGGFLREWMQSLSVLSMDWRLPAFALALAAPTYALSLLTVAFPPSYAATILPLLIVNWTLNLVTMIIFVVAAVILSALGLYRNRFLRPDYAGILVMGSLIEVVLSLVLVSYASSFYTRCAKQTPPCDQLQELTSELWILGSTLLIPAIILFGFAFPKYWSLAMGRGGHSGTEKGPA